MGFYTINVQYYIGKNIAIYKGMCGTFGECDLQGELFFQIDF